MLIVLYGSDSYRRGRKLKEIADEYRKKHSNIAYEIFDFENEAALGLFKEFVGTPSLFSTHKLILAKNIYAAAHPGFLKKILKTLAESQDVTVLISEEKILKDFDFLKNKPNLAQFFDFLHGEQFVYFLKKEIAARGISFDEEALYYFARVLNGDSWSAINELDRLALLPEKTVSLKTLLALRIRPPHDFLTLIRNWQNKTPGDKLFSLETLFAAKEDPAKIFNLAAYQDLRNIKRFADCDVAIKSGKLDYEEALVDLALC